MAGVLILPRLGAAALLAVLLVVLLGGAAESQPQKQAQKEAAFFRLDNGLEVLALRGFASGTAAHMVWYKTGAADEEEGKTGLAHYLEHLMFRDSRLDGQGGFSGRIERIGGEDNAWTSSDYTVYHQKIASARLEEVMALEAARMAELRLSEAAALAERDVVLEERRFRYARSPSRKLYEALLRALYGDDPHGRPVIGYEEDIARLTGEDASRFHRRYYHPANALLVVAGDIVPAEVLRLAKKYYGVLPSGGEPARRFARPPARSGEEKITMTRPQLQREAFYRLYVIPSLAEAGVEQAAGFTLLASVLGGGESARLYRVLAEEKQLAVSASAWSQLAGRGAGIFAISLTPAAGVDLDELAAALDETLEEFFRQGVQADELKRAKSQIYAEAIYARGESGALARRGGNFIVAGGTLADFLIWPELVEQIPAAKVQALARSWLKREGAVSGFLRQPDA